MTVAKKRTNNVASFRAPKLQDIEIEDSNGKVGELRIKPSGILWKPKNGKAYYGVSLEDFAEFAMTKGKKQAK